MNILEVHHYTYGDVSGGVDKVVNEILSDESNRFLFEVTGWSNARPETRCVNDKTIFRKRLFIADKSHSNIFKRIFSGVEYFLTLLWLAYIVKRYQIDIIHLHTLQDYQTYFVGLKKIVSIKYCVTLHRGETIEFPNRSLNQRKLWKKILDNADIVTAVSKELANLAKETFSLQKTPDVTYNGMRDPEFACANEGEVNLLETGCIHFVCAGTLKEYKGHDVIIRAFKDVKSAFPSAMLTILGDGELRDSLHRLSKECGVENDIDFRGFVPMNEAFSLIKQADFFVMPSRNEGLGLALIEAMALGTPVIASNISVFKEFVEDNHSGYLFESENYTNLANVCVSAVTSEKNEKIVYTARKVYEDMFKTVKMNTRYRELFSKLNANQ